MSDERERSQHTDQQGAYEISQEHDTPWAQPVAQDTAQQNAADARDAIGTEENAEFLGITAGEHQPWQSNGIEGIPDRRDDLTAKKQAEIPRIERCEQAFCP